MFYFKEYRKAAGFTVPKLSQLTGLPIRTIEGLEKRGDCLLSNALKIADALGITLNDLLESPENNLNK